MADHREEQHSEKYVSFLVRVWVTHRPGCAQSLNSEVQTIQTGETRQFGQVEDTLTFLEKQIGSITQ